MTDFPFTKATSDYTKYTVFREDQKAALIDYTANDFVTLRTALLNYVKAVYPKDYNLFAESDLGLMMIELISYMASVISMKTDMIAHEMFLKTAKSPTNIRKLLEIIGVRFKGPSSAAATTRIELEEDTVSDGQLLVIPAENRVFTVASPLDGASVNYTLYSTKNGNITDPTADGSIEFEPKQSLDFSANAVPASIWENGVFVEGSFSQDTGTFTDVDALRQVTLQSGPVIEGSVQVLVEGGSNQGVYTEVESLLSTSSSDSKVFQIVYDNEFNATVQFGDGVTGAIPDAGSNYFISYRTGGGVRGNGVTNLINSTVVGLVGSSEVNASISNIRPFTGGTDPETIDHVKRYSKMVFRQQDRLVSLDDYSTFANTYRDTLGNSGKGIAATRKAFSSANIIDIYLLQKATNLQLQKASLSFKTAMLEAMQSKKMITDDVVIVDGLIRTLDLNIRITLDRKYQPNETHIKSKISRAINNYFNVDNREFGEAFYPDDVAREIFSEVDEVRIAEVTNYKDPVQLEFNEILQLNNFLLTMNYV